MADKIVTYAGLVKEIKGSSDEIWLKFLQMQHGAERHTVDEWKALIKHYGDQPGHVTPKKPVAKGA